MYVKGLPSLDGKWSSARPSARQSTTALLMLVPCMLVCNSIFFFFFFFFRNILLFPFLVEYGSLDG